jgi:hypothetical protein
MTIGTHLVMHRTNLINIRPKVLEINIICGQMHRKTHMPSDRAFKNLIVALLTKKASPQFYRSIILLKTRPSLVHIMSQLNPAYILKHYLKIHLNINIIHPSMFKLPIVHLH